MATEPPRLNWPRRGTSVTRDPQTGRWRFAEGPPERAPAELPAGNLAIHGEACDALTALVARRGRSFQLCYIDPPFNTGNELLAYDDRTAHAVWLSALEERAALARELLAPTGFFVAHINVVEQAYLKVLLDEIFGRDELVAQVSWQRAPDRTVLGQGSALVGDQVEYLLVYSRDRTALAGWPRPQRRSALPEKTLRTYAHTLQPSTEAELVAEVGPARVYAHAAYRMGTIPARDVPGAAATAYPEMMRLTNQQAESTFQQALLGQMPRRDTLYRAEYKQARGKHRGERVRYYLNGNVVLWLRDIAVLEGGLLVRVADLNNFWPADDIPATGIAREGGVVMRRGKKPERLLERVISAFSRPGDWVLDFFAGSGTTPAVAARLGRQFVAVEAGDVYGELLVPRLARAGAAFTPVVLR